MTKLVIRYKDFSGDITEMRISDISPKGRDAINAFCHLRQEKRTFKIANIIYAAYPETGELVENPWKLFGLSFAEDGRERISSKTFPILPAIKALKFFSMQIRGFAKRERTHIVRFIQEVLTLGITANTKLR
jgi:predicted DNA-binding transcriptional regulator YafY